MGTQNLPRETVHSSRSGTGTPACAAEVAFRSRTVVGAQHAAPYQGAEKVLLFVIPNEVRDLLFAKCQEKSRFLASCGGSE
jgi:hypothetical protein